MGLDYEILENEYNRIAANRADVEARTDLTDDERKTVLESLDRALEGVESGIVALGIKAKEEIQSAIAGLEEKLSTNEKYIASAEEELEKRRAELEEELAKENPDEGIIGAKKSEIEALEKRIKSLTSSLRKVKQEIKEQNKLLIPLMNRFGDKIFTEQEIADLTRLEKSIERGKALSQKNREKEISEEPAQEEPAKDEKEEVATEEPVIDDSEVIAVDETIIDDIEVVSAEEPVVDNLEEIIVDETIIDDVEEIIVDEPITDEPVVTEEEPVITENVQGNTENIRYVATNVNVPNENVVEEQEEQEKNVVKTDADLKKEFNELYKKAKKRNLSQEDYDRLAEITANPENYDKLGITSGILFNKSKVILRAMGERATQKAYMTVNDAFDAFGLTVVEPDGNVFSTGDAMSWSGIQSMVDVPNSRLVSEELFERVMLKARDIGVDNLNKQQLIVLQDVLQHHSNMKAFRYTMDAYKEVKDRRREKWNWLFDTKTLEALPEATYGEQIPDIDEQEVPVAIEIDSYEIEGDTFTEALKGEVIPENEIQEHNDIDIEAREELGEQSKSEHDEII